MAHKCADCGEVMARESYTDWILLDDGTARSVAIQGWVCPGCFVHEIVTTTCERNCLSGPLGCTCIDENLGGQCRDYALAHR